MTDNRNPGAKISAHDMEYYINRARVERGKAARRFFRRLVGAADRADTNTWG